MKGVILAGGLGTRLYPLTHATNKHLLPVYDKPMIYYPIQTLVKAGIKDIMLVVSGPHSGHFINVLKNGKDFGVDHLEFAYQEKADGGIVDALSYAEDFAGNEPIAFILGDNTTDADISPAVKNFKSGATIFLKQVPDPQRFGVPRFDSEDPKRILEIIEKPENPPSNYASCGLYILDSKTWEYIPHVKPSARGQLEIPDLLNFYVTEKTLTWEELKGYWLDCGTFDTLQLANLYWAKKNGSTFLQKLIKEFGLQ